MRRAAGESSEAPCGSPSAPPSRGYWIPLTVAIVVRPELGHVMVRAFEHAAGTLAGAAFGAGILTLVGTQWGAIPVAAALAGALPIAIRRNRILLGGTVSALVVVLIASLVGHGIEIAEARVVDTLIGCVIALIFGHLLWRAGERLRGA